MQGIIDHDQLKRNVSFVDYVRARLGEPHNAGYGSATWNTPFRNTTGNSPSFTVWDRYNNGAGYAVDFGDAGKSRDIYQFIMELDNVSFRDAVNSLYEWANGHPASLIVNKPSYPAKQRSYSDVTWDAVRKAEVRYPHVQPYIELKRKIAGEVAHKSHIGGVTWQKNIQFGGKTKAIPVNRAVFPYYFGDSVHGWVSRRDDMTFLERLEWEFNGITETTRHKLWLASEGREYKDISDKEVIEAIHNNMWTPEQIRDKYNATALLRWHAKGRRSIYNVDQFCRIENGQYVWNVNSIIIHESETDALACQSVCSPHTANIAYKIHNHLHVPLWKVLGTRPIVVYIAVQNDETSRNLARQLTERLAYSKENYGQSQYVLNYLYTPSGFGDFGDMQSEGKLADFFRKHPIGSK